MRFSLGLAAFASRSASTAAASTFVPRSDYMSVRTRAIRRTTCSIVQQQLMGRRAPLIKKSSGVGVANDCRNPDGYSSRSASTGATLDARSAGSNDAASTVARDVVLSKNPIDAITKCLFDRRMDFRSCSRRQSTNQPLVALTPCPRCHTRCGLFSSRSPVG